MSNCLTVNYTLFFPALKCYYYKSERDFPVRKGPVLWAIYLLWNSIPTERAPETPVPGATAPSCATAASRRNSPAASRRPPTTIYSDSQYFCNGITKGWAESWRQNGWRKKDKKPALNPDLWEELLGELGKHEVTIEWVKGHAGHPENERCDRLAVEAYQQYLK